MEQVFDWDRLGANDLVGRFEIRPETMARLMRAEIGWQGEGTYFLVSEETNEVVVGHDKENTSLTIQAKVVRYGDFTRTGSAGSISRRPSSAGSKASQTQVSSLYGHAYDAEGSNGPHKACVARYRSVYGKKRRRSIRRLVAVPPSLRYSQAQGRSLGVTRLPVARLRIILFPSIHRNLAKTRFRESVHWS